MTTTIRIVRSTINRKAWLVWVSDSFGAGYLRMGFAWKTQGGAIRAAQRAYPGIQPIIQG